MYKSLAVIITLYLLQSSIVLSQTSLNMTLEGTWDDPANSYNDCWGYTDKEGNEYAIIGSKTKIHFLDISTASAPVYLQGFSGSYSGIAGANSTWRDIKTYENYAYAVADVGNEGLMIFDLTDLPSGSVSKVYQKNSKFGRAHNIYIDVPQSKLYVIGSNTQNSGLIVYDLAEDPSDPPVIASVNVSGNYIHDAFVYNDTVYASSGYDGFYIIDMTTPTSPSLIGTNKTPAAGYNHSGWFYDNGNKYIVAEEVPKGLKLAVFDISNPSSPSFMDDFRHPLISGSGLSVTYHNPYMIGDYAIISSYEDGITIMDVSDPSNTTLDAYYDTFSNSSYSGYAGCWGTYPFFPSETIIGSDISTGLYVLSTTLSLDNTCGNGIKDGFEQDVDCGGFCAACECAAPNDAIVLNLKPTLSRIEWSPVDGALGYELRYRISGSTQWTTISLSSPTFSFSTSGNAVYEFQLRSDCGSRLTGFHPIQSFQSGSNCLAHQIYTGPQADGVYEAQLKINSTVKIAPSSLVYYSAGDSICLDNEFYAPPNSNFEAEIRGCNAMLLKEPASSSYVGANQDGPTESDDVPTDLYSFSKQGESGITILKFYCQTDVEMELLISDSFDEKIISIESCAYQQGWNLIKFSNFGLEESLANLKVTFKKGVNAK